MRKRLNLTAKKGEEEEKETGREGETLLDCDGGSGGGGAEGKRQN